MLIGEGQKRMVFISYSSKESAKAYALKSILVANGIECWMAPESIPSGSDYGVEIPKAIKSCDVFVLLLSSNAQESQWVPKELDYAITCRKHIIPFHIDDSDILDAFNFRLSNVQRIECYNRSIEAYKDLVLSLFRILGMTQKEFVFSNSENENQNKSEVKTNVKTDVKSTQKTASKVIFDTWFCGDKGYLMMRSPESKTKENGVLYDFTEETWQICAEYIREIVAIINLTHKDFVKVTPIDEFGIYKCIPADNYIHTTSIGRFDFKIEYISDGYKRDYDNCHMEIRLNRVKLSMYYKGDYVFKIVPADTRLSHFAIDEERLVEVLKEFVAFLNGVEEENLMMDKQFRNNIYSDKSGTYQLKYMVR